MGWWLRNPMHNWTFYGIGFANQRVSACRRNPATALIPGFNWTFISPWKWLYLFPFLSYQGKWVEWYIGWRPPLGDFGIKLRRHR